MTEKGKTNVRSITSTALMAAIVFLFTYVFKIPVANGYVHLGDAMIFLSVAILGTKRASLAGAIGGGLADLIGGYAIWCPITFFIKLFLALICGGIYSKMNKKSVGFIIGAIVAGVFQVGAYSLANALLYDAKTVLVSAPADAVQTAVGIVVGIVLIFALEKTNALEKIKKLTQ